MIKYLSQTKDLNHYLLIGNSSSHQYTKDFAEVYHCYIENFPSEIKNWLPNKMLLNTLPFNTKQFIQFACEATIVKYFAEHYKTNLAIEKKINPANNMDVDLVFSENGFIFNIEIKCSDFKAKEAIDATNTLKIQPIGRLEGFNETLAELQELLKPVAEKLNLDAIVAAKNMDNSLKDFLLGANNKFNPASTDKELNILSVSCNDAEDMQLWYYYMFKDKGLFTSASFHQTAEFENVDVVILNNLYYKHNEYFHKRLLNSWDFGNCFNLIFINPFAKQKKKAAVNELLRICPNQNAGFNLWNMPGNAEEEVKDSRRIADFIKSELEGNQKLYFFDQPFV
ncbi:MAG: hypothetical protein QM764_04600 [Chitinophagaceae bacterium]